MKNERLKWACRRGMLELDMLLTPFYDKYFHTLTAEQKHIFEELLSHQDPELFDWFIGFSAPKDQKLQTMIQLIKNAKVIEHDH